MIEPERMTDDEVATLNALVTYAAENIPGGLTTGERTVAKKVGGWALSGSSASPVRRVKPRRKQRPFRRSPS